MNKNSIVLLIILALVGAGLFAMVDYQHGRATPPAGAAQAAAPSAGGLVINGLSVGPAADPTLETAPVVPAASEADAGEACP
ncbi:MAG: hypothetical protein Q8M76_13415 [Spirochaetaceae bacterium]|nr:hypothetical protein [Spirochaetaceae bacterium]